MDSYQTPISIRKICIEIASVYVELDKVFIILYSVKPAAQGEFTQFSFSYHVTLEDDFVQLNQTTIEASWGMRHR